MSAEQDRSDLAVGLAESLAQYKKKTRRVIVLNYVLLIVILATFFTYFHDTQAASDHDRHVFQAMTNANCQSDRSTVLRFNAFIDKLNATITVNATLTPAEKAARIEFFNGGKSPFIPVCPPIARSKK